MPTYEYKCNKCGLIFEVFQSMKDDPLKKCQKQDCDGEVTRLISAGAGLIFKGNGFYITDYRSDSYKKAAQSESGSKSPASSSEKSTTTANKASSPAKSNSKDATSS